MSDEFKDGFVNGIVTTTIVVLGSIVGRLMAMAVKWFRGDL